MNTKQTLYTLIGLVAVLAIIFLISFKFEKNTATDTSTVTLGTIGNLQKATPPWPVEFAHLKERLAAIGLPALTEEGTKLHIHQHLDLLIDGQAVDVPMGIGIDPQEQFISPIHVHDTSGVIHVESPTVQTFTLGQFFDIWGLTFNAQCIGGECTSASASLKVYVNGQLYQGDPRALALAAHQEIFIFYGTPDQLPKVIPATFAFPEGY